MVCLGDLLMNDDVKFGYALGQRDMLASILAETNKKIKLPDQAKFYEKHYGEHFSLDWHKS